MTIPVTKTNGKVVEIDCDYFADEDVPREWVVEHCYDMKLGIPKCVVHRECYGVYTRRIDQE